MSWTNSRRSGTRTRMRRMRSDAFSRALMQEHHVTCNDLIYPMFVLEGSGKREAISSMPGIERLSADLLVKRGQATTCAGYSMHCAIPDNRPKQKIRAR